VSDPNSDLAGRRYSDPDAPHVDPSISYIPSLDGIRAFAVLGVMAYHGGVPWMAGGFLGVDAFFVLSGFLITTLLLGEWAGRQTIRLGRFWARRARRLLPALLLMILFVVAYAAFVAPRGMYPDLRLDALSTLFYVANWHFILIGSNYFAQSGPVSPLTHTWSLAIEEQFYLVWPLVVLAVMKLTRSLGTLLFICVVGALASAGEMAVLYRDGSSITRLYYGTDTHAQSLLIGATLAVSLGMVAQSKARRAINSTGDSSPGGNVSGTGAWIATRRSTRTLLNIAGLIGFVACGLLWVKSNGNDGFLYEGGFLAAGIATTAVLVSVLCVTKSPIGTILSLRPLRYLGRISYGMYLWHFPLFIWLDHARTGLSGYDLFAFRVAVTIGVATVSFYVVERPIRQGTFFKGLRAWLVTPVAVAGTIAAVVVATSLPALGAPVTAPLPRTNSSLYSGPPVRVLIEGDSTALTLGMGLSESVKHYDIIESDQAILGCGVVSGAQVQIQGVDDPSASECNGSRSTQQWPQQWESWIQKFDPNVVMVLAGRWEVSNRTYHGKWTNILHPKFAAYVKRQLEFAVKVAASRGAKVVFLTAPCYDSGEQPNGDPWPADSIQRVKIYNNLLKEVVAQNAGTATLVNLFSMVCPNGKYEEFIHNVQVREPDGIHFTIQGGAFLAPRIWPTVVEAGRAQMKAAIKTNTG
jgi:peptidoglycan/LPS O-acetylase OafA/YrhL